MSILATQKLNGHEIRPSEAEGKRARTRTAPANTRNTSSSPINVDLPRSASYTYVGNARERGLLNQTLVKGAFSEVDLISEEDDTGDTSPPDSSGVNTPEERLPEIGVPAMLASQLRTGLQFHTNQQRHAITGTPNDSKSSLASSTKHRRSSFDSSRPVSTATTAPTTPRPRASVTSNFSRKLNRQSWISSTPATPSRSPSPPKKDTTDESRDSSPDKGPLTPQPTLAKRRKSLLNRRSSWKPVKDNVSDKDTPPASNDESDASVSRKSTLLRKKTRPVSGLFRALSSEGKGKSDTYSPIQTTTRPPVPELPPKALTIENGKPATYKPSRPAVPALPKSFSTDKLPIVYSEQLSPNRAAPLPRLLSSDRVASSNTPLPKKKDELWGVFRSLDGDYSKFTSKSVALKANVVRSNLLPFLRNYATHPSNKTLRPEDLDRRTNILNKWWTGLIEMLHGRNNQSISGTDRPAILDGIAGIMERPEWRVPSPFAALNQRFKDASSPRNRSTNSLASNSSEFLTESVHHNVRNIFIQNLSAQMAFVVDKMSMRNASASLVSFCGKACAYAFMFVPGMADVLVRLWELHIDPLRRVLEGNGIGKFDNLAGVAAGIVQSFPPALQQLGFTSLTKYMRKLRTPPPLPVGMNNIQWWGHWTERWTGRDSDLFYVFAKYFHILATDFLPSGSSMTERMCAPGFLLVHAQILTNLDATIHRESNQAQQDPTTAGVSPTFDDVLTDPDAVATTLPMPPTNAVRLMSENRLIMLIRDFLSDRVAQYPVARRLFAESFSNLLQTTARGTSVFDHAACYTLLDFLEEALLLLARFERMIENQGSLVDLGFWTTVLTKMISSHNTMTEIRLYAFLYTVWNTVICDLGWKAALCDEFLLDPYIFGSRFNHWCPMVRAYYMRLLCWRVGRYDGESSDTDIATYETMLDRLRTVWSHYIYLRAQADIHDIPPPTTSPCHPAPSRRLLIIRTDPQLNPSGAFLSFDGIVSPRTPSDASTAALKRGSTISHVIEIDTRPGSSMSSFSEFENEPRGRTFGGFLRNLMPTKSRSKSQGPAQAKNGQDSAPTPEPMPVGRLRSATDDFQPSRPVLPRATAADSPTVTKPTPPPSQHKNFSFKFSLEYQQSAKPLPKMRLFPPRLPMPAQQLLQTTSRKVNLSNVIHPLEPTGESKAHARYCGRALAEWAVVLGECQSFFERRKNEGVPSNKFVETPMMGVEVFKRPG